MSNSRPKQTSSSRILTQLGATATSISNVLHQVSNAITAQLNSTSETRAFYLDPESMIPDQEFETYMQEQPPTVKHNK
jgi:hypothetical protein